MSRGEVPHDAPTDPGAGRRIWQDLKTDGTHAYIASESYYHGMLVFDLTDLRDLEATTDTSLQLEPSAHHDPDQCEAGLHAIDISNPDEPTFAGCWTEDAYIHDAQCTRYAGGDADHVGKGICLTANEDSVSVVDMTDPQTPTVLSRTTSRTFLLGDELDEDGSVPTTTMSFDVTDRDDIRLVDKHAHDSTVIDDAAFNGTCSCCGCTTTCWRPTPSSSSAPA